MLARRGASRYTCCATGHQASVLAQAAALLPSERAATTRSLDESAGDNWLRCFRSTARIHSTARQRDLLDACELYVENEASEGRLPPKTKIRRAAARLEPYRATLEAPADADALARARFAKVCFAAMRGGARGPRRRRLPRLWMNLAAILLGRFLAAARRCAGAFHSVRRPVDRSAATPRGRSAAPALRAAGGPTPETLALLCRRGVAARSAARPAGLRSRPRLGFGGGPRLIEAGADPAYADDEGWTA